MKKIMLAAVLVHAFGASFVVPQRIPYREAKRENIEHIDEVSRDCREYDFCLLPNGERGYCRQIFCGIGGKCFTCNHGSAGPPV